MFARRLTLDLYVEDVYNSRCNVIGLLDLAPIQYAVT